MNVLLVTSYYPCQGGGVEIVAGHIATQLKGFGVSLTWCALGVEDRLVCDLELGAKPLCGTNVVERRVGVPYPLIGFSGLMELVRQVRRCDILHIHDFIYFSNLFSWCVAKICGKPIVITQHIGMIPYKSTMLRASLSIVNRLIGRCVLTYSNKVFFISIQVQKYFEGISGLGEKAHWSYLPNGVDRKVFYKHKSRVNRSGVGAPVILFVGRFVEKKGLDLLKALAIGLPELQWVFVGEGPLNPALWGQENVEVLGYLSRENMGLMYQSADMLILPSFGEGFPLVIQEALSSGLPVLTSSCNVEGFDAANSFLFTEDLDGTQLLSRWMLRVESILSSTGAVDKKIEVGLRYAEENWDWNSIGMKYYETFSGFTKN